MHWSMVRVVCATGLLAVALLACSSSQPLPTIDGPEDDSVLQNARGIVLVNGPDQSLIAISLPDMARRVIKDWHGLPLQRLPFITHVSGPSKDGHIVYVEDYFFAEDKKSLLKMSMRDGSRDKVVKEFKGSALHHDFIGDDLVLSQDSGKIAFVGKYEDVTPPKLRDMASGFFLGPLEIWSLDPLLRIETNLQAEAKRSLAWFPDNKRLAYTTLLSRSQLVKEPSLPEDLEEFEGLDVIPVIMIFDFATRRNEFFHVGWRPIISLDGEYIMLEVLNGRWRLVDVRTRKSSPATWPGPWRRFGPVAFVGKDLLLYGGLPTTGSKQQFTEGNSPVVGPKAMGTLKVADLKTGKFKTILDPVDPRWKVSFGQQ